MRALCVAMRVLHSADIEPLSELWRIVSEVISEEKCVIERHDTVYAFMLTTPIITNRRGRATV
jgi:hypothetical protein